MRRRAATLIVTFLLFAFTAPAAHADDGDAWANTPNDGIGSVIDQGPPVHGTGDPFAKTPTGSIYDTYGYGFLEWRVPPHDDKGNWLSDLITGNYGPGKSVNQLQKMLTDGDAQQSLLDNAVNGINSFGLMGLSILTSITAFLLRLAYHPTWLHLLDPFQRIGTEVFGREVFMGLEWVTLCCSGIWLIAKARKARFTVVAHEGSWVGLTVILAFVAIIWPLTIAPAINNAVAVGMGSVNTKAGGFDASNDSTASDGATALIHKSLDYDVWCSGLVGRDAGRKIADEYCPRLLKASTFSYQEMKDTAGDPGKRAALSNQKYDDYKAALGDLCDESPTACANATGDKPWTRFGAVFLGYIGALSILPFLLVAAGLIAAFMARVVITLAVFPLLALVGGFPPLKGVVLRAGDGLIVSLKAMLTMGIGCTVLMAAVGGILSPATQTNPVEGYLGLAVISIAAWFLLKPHRQILAGLGKVPKGAKRLRWQTPEHRDGEWADPDYNNTTPDQGGPRERRYVHSVPVEADPPPRTSTVKAAVQGGVTAAALGVATGGAATLAGVAKGALTGVAGEKLGAAPAAVASAMLAPGKPQSAPAELEAPLVPSGNRLPAAPTRVTPTPVEGPRPRVYVNSDVVSGQVVDRDPLRLIPPQHPEVAPRVYEGPVALPAGKVTV